MRIFLKKYWCRQYIVLLGFFLIALLPMQDVSGGAQTYLGAAHILFGSCYASIGVVTCNSRTVTSSKLHNMGSKSV
jgi:hypothetical protein